LAEPEREDIFIFMKRSGVPNHPALR